MLINTTHNHHIIILCFINSVFQQILYPQVLIMYATMLGLLMIALTFDVGVCSPPPPPPPPTPPPPCKNSLQPGRCPENTLPDRCVLDLDAGRLQWACHQTDCVSNICKSYLFNVFADDFTCPPNYVWVGTNNNHPICCKLNPNAVFLYCYKPKVLYSFELGFDYQVPDGFGLVGKCNFKDCPDVFQVIICKILKKKPFKDVVSLDSNGK
ncbi:uncharacterized protein [Argopecten irradians]|uniref:uncharacterized protein n=1 Tax=Argopecten irradians TaxID=31199 RepID=UPI00371DBFDC